MGHFAIGLVRKTLKFPREDCQWLKQLIRCQLLLEAITPEAGKLTEIPVCAYVDIPKALLGELGLPIKARFAGRSPAIVARESLQVLD